jgi:hypothetical protein
MKLRAIMLAVSAALLLAAPAAGMRWLDEEAPTITVSDITVEAAGPGGSAVSFDSSITVAPADAELTCDHSSGSAFPIGVTAVQCNAHNAFGDAPASFNVTVQDTTAPSVDSHPDVSDTTTAAGAVENFSDPSASDSAGGVGVVCAPASGSTFAIGTTSVTCTATDDHGNSAATSFNVNITDAGNPTFTTTPGDITAEATSSAGAAVTYSVAASDNSGAAPAIDCAAHGSGSTFPLGPATAVTCTATDGAGNSATTSFNVTVHDTTAPSLTLPANVTVEADSPAGKIVAYSASAGDTVSGSVDANCSPASGSTFPLGSTTVNCNPHDAAGNAAHGNFTVTVADTTGPTFSSVSSDKVVEANGPAGSVVNYPAATAVDGVDGPILSPPCTPATNTLFPLGTTTVTCNATDAHSNVGHASFSVSVLDRTKPALNVPADASAYADSPLGLPKNGYGAAQFLAAAHAADLVDLNPHVINDAPELLTVGVHVITFSASDASHNGVSKTALFEVRPMPPPGTAPLPIPGTRKPPANVTNFKAEGGDARVRLSWQLPSGVDHVVLSRSLTAGGDAQRVYTGSAASFTDRGVANGLEYRYLVVSVDRNGDESAGVAAVALPKRSLLLTPKDGARLKKAPKLLWAKNAEADYYNVQVFRGAVKILSIWPVGTSLGLKHSWKYRGRAYKLTRGVYRWYVWPGFGARSAIDYGELLGSRSFQITR